VQAIATVPRGFQEQKLHLPNGNTSQAVLATTETPNVLNLGVHLQLYCWSAVAARF
jgi:hypothetical protein